MVAVTEIPVMEVQGIKPYRGVVTQWRASRGTTVRTGNTRRSIVKKRLAFSPSEAGDLAGVATRTIHLWREQDLWRPTFTAPKLGVEDHRFCSADLLGLRAVADMGDAGFDPELRRLVAWSLAETLAYDPDGAAWSLSDHAGLWTAWYFPSDVALAEQLMEEEHGCWFTTTSDPAIEHGPLSDVVERHADQFVEYPFMRRVMELRDRIDSYWRKDRVAESARPSWLT